MALFLCSGAHQDRPVIVRKGGTPYWNGMSALLRLLALAALLLMPFGMGLGVGQAAAAQPAHPMNGSMAEGHCDRSADQEKGKAATGTHCGAACSALPAQPAGALASQALSRAALTANSVELFSGTIPPPATPPPRQG